MSLPEGYLPRKGDELLIRVRVKSDTQLNDDCYAEVVGCEHLKIFMKPSEIHALHCRHWNKGARVTSLEFDGPGTVLATSDDWVWVMCENGDDEGGLYTLEANSIEPYVEPSTGSQSLVGDDDPVS